MAIDTDGFKLAMRRLAGHVCLITTANADGTRSGLTATAVCSVSAEPPTLLICLNRQSATHAAIQASGVFAVNVLALDNRALADRFSSRVSSEEKFAQGVWSTQQTGAPILEGALASFDCRISQAVDIGTHGIMFGAIEAIQARTTEAKPLLYAHGGYGGFSSFAAASNAELLWMPSWDADVPELS